MEKEGQKYHYRYRELFNHCVFMHHSSLAFRVPMHGAEGKRMYTLAARYVRASMCVCNRPALEQALGTIFMIRPETTRFVDRECPGCHVNQNMTVVDATLLNDERELTVPTRILELTEISNDIPAKPTQGVEHVQKDHTHGGTSARHAARR